MVGMEGRFDAQELLFQQKLRDSNESMQQIKDQIKDGMDTMCDMLKQLTSHVGKTTIDATHSSNNKPEENAAATEAAQAEPEFAAAAASASSLKDAAVAPEREDAEMAVESANLD